MIENILHFITATWKSGFEILIITVVLYYSYRYLSGTRGARIFFALALLILGLTLVSQVLDLVVISWILHSLSVFLALALVVIFQPELRRLLTDLGTHHLFSSAFQKKEVLEELIDSLFELSSKGFGALIAIEREISLRSIAESGSPVDCLFSKDLVVTIFHPKTVLHDGGLIMQNDRIVAAACIFPLTQREDLDRNLGLRHRAALGITEESDAVAIIVSEETGHVSICHSGMIEANLNVERCRQRLNELLFLKNEETDSTALES
ncbi:MAG: diadenylate cyclase CdaA [Chthoniobacterales bacterium]